MKRKRKDVDCKHIVARNAVAGEIVLDDSKECLLLYVQVTDKLVRMRAFDISGDVMFTWSMSLDTPLKVVAW